MKLKKKQLDYDIFHKETSVQRRIINKNNFTYKQIFRTIDKYLVSPKDVLDIGCGAGTISLYYGNAGNKVLGIDISQKAVASAQKSAKFLKLKNCNFSQLNFPLETPKKTFDFIIFTEVIEHLEDDELALKKIYKLLKPGGIAFISTPSINAPLYKIGIAKEFDKKVGHLRRYSLEGLVNKAKESGFEILETKRTEGIVRNFLFLNPIAGKTVRFIKFFLTDVVTFVDNISLKLFGESNIYIIVQKPR